MNKFVRIDDKGIIQFEVETNIDRHNPNFIKVEDFESVRGKKWNGSEWVEYVPEDDPEPTLSEMEAAVYETQASAEYNTCLLELLSM